MPEQMDVVISPEGNVILSVKGVQGKACLEITKQIEALLGEVEERKLCPEYYKLPHRLEVGPVLRNLTIEEE